MSIGYKDSPLGKIPSDWKLVTVKEITEDHKQGFYTKDGYVDEGIRLARITDLNNPKVDYSEMPKLNISDSDYQNYKIEKGDFLFARSGAIGRYGIVENDEFPAVFASYLIRFRFKKDIVNRFFGYFFESYLCGNQLRSITQGNANVNINAENIKSLKFPFAPHPEQQKIAEILSTVDAKIEVIDLQITETQELKKGLMQRLLTKGIGHTEFKDSALGEIPKSWEVVKCESIADITSSKRVYLSDYTDNGIPFFRGKEITQLAKGEKLNDLVYIKEETFIEFKNKFGAPKEGDILITAVGTIGSIYMVNSTDNFYFKDGNLMWLREIDSRLNKQFITHYFRSIIFQNLIDIISGGSSQKALTIVKFKKLPVVIPPFDEQTKISEILDSIYEKVSALEEKKTHYQELKHGLM